MTTLNHAPGTLRSGVPGSGSGLGGAPAAGAHDAGTRDRARAWAATTPGGLRLASAVMVLLILVAALVAASAVSTRHRATRTIAAGTAPLLVEAQGIYTALSDADTTAAGGFLYGGLAPATVATRYSGDIAQATAALAAAAQHAGTSATASAALATLSGAIPVYTGLIETARANNRQGFPVGAAYLSEASNLMRTAILPAAGRLLAFERRSLQAGHDTAGGLGLVVVAAVAGAAVLMALALLQRRLARRFRRTFNLALLAATAAVVAGIVWAVLALAAQAGHLDQAQRQGSAPIATLTQARILALQARADDELTLVTRDAVPGYQADYATVIAQLEALLATSPGATPPAVQQAVAQARASVTAYQKLHSAIRTADSGGNLSAAIALDSGTSAQDVPAVSDHLDHVLASAITTTQTRFSHLASAAAGDLSGLTWVIALLSLLAAALVLVGVQPRIDEYR